MMTWICFSSACGLITGGQALACSMECFINSAIALQLCEFASPCFALTQCGGYLSASVSVDVTIVSLVRIPSGTMMASMV
ncbi:hypothetical protein K438DRAFT_360956 [Mycena galopus ATCC 62051]|nr:hypothetical protein K438DRAFT_360956 [Mycena galopus ATCC 62051]